MKYASTCNLWSRSSFNSRQLRIVHPSMTMTRLYEIYWILSTNNISRIANALPCACNRDCPRVKGDSYWVQMLKRKDSKSLFLKSIWIQFFIMNIFTNLL